MILRTLAASLAVIAVPIAVVGAAEPDAKADYSTKKICDVTNVTGSRLGGVRRCRTQAEREQAKAESRDVVSRIQSQKNFTEEMARAGVRAMCKGSRAC
ncbi:MAG TPA: hypothetical protein VEW71_04825 [Allosphingosinicella sp.]|nr:hypothetical protein [Allosphingosinicella sp.]